MSVRYLVRITDNEECVIPADKAVINESSVEFYDKGRAVACFKQYIFFYCQGHHEDKEETFPFNPGEPNSAELKQRADDLRDPAYWARRGEETGKQQAAELSKYYGLPDEGKDDA